MTKELKRVLKEVGRFVKELEQGNFKVKNSHVINFNGYVRGCLDTQDMVIAELNKILKEGE